MFGLIFTDSYLTKTEPFSLVSSLVSGVLPLAGGAGAPAGSFFACLFGLKAFALRL